MYDREVGVRSGGTLHITDSRARAMELIGKGEAVLVYLHDGNRQEDFGSCKYACEDITELSEEYLDKVYRRQKGLPVSILETKRCLIRETTVEDVEAFYEIYAEPSVTEYMEALFEDPEEERAYTRDYIDQVYGFYDFGIWTVVEKEGGAVIGRAGICYREGFEDPELGFVIGVPWQGKGFATEVCTAILSYAEEQLGFERILAFVQPGNAVSKRVCEKIGMERSRQTLLKGFIYDIYLKYI